MGFKRRFPVQEYYLGGQEIQATSIVPRRSRLLDRFLSKQAWLEDNYAEELLEEDWLLQGGKPGVPW